MSEQQPREVRVSREAYDVYRKVVARAELAEHKLKLAELAVAQRDETIQVLRDTLGALQSQANLAAAINMSDIASLKGRTQ